MPPAHPRWARHTLSVAASAVRHTGRDLVSVGPLCLPWTEPHREDDSLMTHIRRARGATLAGLVVSALALTTVMSACSSQTPATASATSRMTARPTSTADRLPHHAAGDEEQQQRVGDRREHGRLDWGGDAGTGCG